MPSASGYSNCQISGPSAGVRKVIVTRISHGLSIIATSDDEARSRRAFYPILTTAPSFAITIAHVSWEDRDAFNQWMSKFMADVSEGRAKNGVVTVRVPSRNFVRVGVPQGDLEYGEGVGDLAYHTTINFVGATDPTDPTLHAKDRGASYFKAGANTGAANFFYPSSIQIKGAESADSTVFGNTADGGNFLINPTINKPGYFDDPASNPSLNPAANKPAQDR